MNNLRQPPVVITSSLCSSFFGMNSFFQTLFEDNVVLMYQKIKVSLLPLYQPHYGPLMSVLQSNRLKLPLISL